jgi:hypothetical protein
VELRNAVPDALLAGSKLFTYWGFEVYDASLWVTPGFQPADYERHVFALELRYRRAFTNQDISARSIEEMRRLGNPPPAQLQTWEQQLRGAFPDVRRGDRIAGINQPGDGIVFMTIGKQTGAIRDPEFARLFFGTWLSPRTSEPGLRAALLAHVASR